MCVEIIDSFVGEYAFLSNFYPVQIEYGGEIYPSAEHAFQAAKTPDEEQRKKIREALNPGQAKRLGRRVSLRKDWSSVKVSVMRDLLRQKFGAGSDLAQRLLDTGNAKLVEGNTWDDVYWGVCEGRGQNKLGLLLMEIREELRIKMTSAQVASNEADVLG